MIRLVVALICSTATAHADAPTSLESASAIAIDVATGAELYAKRADDVRAIASMTKIFAAMVVRKHHVNLGKSTKIIYDDAKAGIGGAHTLLIEGETFANADLFAAMMLVSDNRVPTALARSAGMSPEELLDGMRKVAKDLGLSHTSFDDVTGIAGNASTAREMALALRAVLRDPVIAKYMATRYATVESESKSIKAEYKSTVGPMFDKTNRVVGGKTGHTEAAGYCMIIETVIGERTVAMAFLGAPTRDASFVDFTRLRAMLAK